MTLEKLKNTIKIKKCNNILDFKRCEKAIINLNYFLFDYSSE